ncbi:hypothetical protein ACFQ6Q_04235 [Streptomyces sp. NPDC056437]|uniref:hypothetical protein n=1 Tax=Streptomyces sp. NPDC056437 TaxID=3345816 RepID=UPI0036A3C3F4
MPTPTKPVLENFYNVPAAAVRLGLQDPKDPEDKRGEKWLRDGVNQDIDPFPSTRMAGQLMFSDSHLAEIAGRHENKPEARGRRRGPRKPAAAVPPQRTKTAA